MDGLIAGTPSSGANATVAVLNQRDTKKGAKAAQKAVDFNKAFGGQA